MVLSLTGCGGCDVILVKAFTRLDLEPYYHKMLVENLALPDHIDLLIVTGCVATPREGLLLARASRAARQVILAGCCALRGLLVPGRGAAGKVCKPPKMLVEAPHVYTIPGCPVLELFLEKILERVVASSGASMFVYSLRGG